MSAHVSDSPAFVTDRGARRAWGFFDSGQRVAMWLPAAWLVVSHGLFALTALQHREWPHPPGLYRDATHLANDPLYATHPDNPFIGYCRGTFDPKGYGLLYDAGIGLLIATMVAAMAWIPLSCVAGYTLHVPQKRRQAVFVGGLACVVLTMFLDPLGVWSWFVD